MLILDIIIFEYSTKSLSLVYIWIKKNTMEPFKAK